MRWTPDLIWREYSQKLTRKSAAPRCSGKFTQEQAKAHEMRLAIGTERDGAFWVTIFLLVDETDGIIADAKFQCYGPSALIGLAETACENVIRKTYDQASKMSADFIEKSLRDRPEKVAFPECYSPCLTLVKSAIASACRQCMDIPLEIHSPIDSYAHQGGEYPDWGALSQPEKLALIETIIAAEIRPYIELDEGDVEILQLRSDREVVIGYKGACTSCYSATGATLDAIQGILRARVHPALVVIPDLSFLSHS